jgi:hypothetical protein
MRARGQASDAIDQRHLSIAFEAPLRSLAGLPRSSPASAAPARGQSIRPCVVGRCPRRSREPLDRKPHNGEAAAKTLRNPTARHGDRGLVAARISALAHSRPWRRRIRGLRSSVVRFGFRHRSASSIRIPSNFGADQSPNRLEHPSSTARFDIATISIAAGSRTGRCRAATPKRRARSSKILRPRVRRICCPNM